MKTLTAEAVVAAAQGKKSVSAVAKALGCKGNPSGSLCKKIRALVPNLNDILTGKAPVEVAEVKTAKVAKGTVPWAPESKMGITFAIGHAPGWHSLHDIIAQAANTGKFKDAVGKDGKPLEFGDPSKAPGGKNGRNGRCGMVYSSYTMISSTVHPTNGGKAQVVQKDPTQKKGFHRLMRFELIEA